jgi:conjugal transfer mating pair stabilization protein TraN
VRRALSITVLIALCAGARAQNPHDEGVQAGQNAQGVISGFINQGSATAVLPPGYYNANPPQASLYGSPSLSGFTAAQIAYCNTAAAANDVTCQAISTALSSAATPRPPVLATDPAVTTANAVANNPGAVRPAELQQLLPALDRQCLPEEPHRRRHLAVPARRHRGADAHHRQQRRS